MSFAISGLSLSNVVNSAYRGVVSFTICRNFVGASGDHMCGRLMVPGNTMIGRYGCEIFSIKRGYYISIAIHIIGSFGVCGAIRMVKRSCECRTAT